jgi:hypothetical protein
MNSDVELAREALKRIGDEFGDAAANAEITRLGGMTNLVFRVDAEGGRLCLRLPGKGTETYINRKVEAVERPRRCRSGRLAGGAPLGLDGVMATAFIEGAVTMSPAAFRERPARWSVRRTPSVSCTSARRTSRSASNCSG